MSSTPFFQSVWLSEPEAPRTSRALIVPALSVLAHVGGLLAFVVLPLLSQDALPAPADGVKAVFASPLELAAPAPPPPPAAPRAAARIEPPRPTETRAFIAPVEVPSEIVPESTLDLGVEGGVASGVEGGVPGGVVGGIVGGLPEAPPPPTQPIRVGGVVKEPRKLKDVRPEYPDLAVKSRVEGVVILECILDTRGRVQQAKVLRGVPLLQEAALDAVRQWVYSITLVDGQPVPVILTVTVTFKLR